MKVGKLFLPTVLTAVAIFFAAAHTGYAQKIVDSHPKLLNGDLKMLKGKTRVFVAGSDSNALIVDLVRSNSDLIVVADRSEADFSIHSYSYPSVGGNRYGTGVAATAVADIWQPYSNPSNVASTQVSGVTTKLSVTFVDGDGNTVFVWDKSLGVPVPSLAPPVSTSNTNFKLTSDESKVKLANRLLDDLKKIN